MAKQTKSTQQSAKPKKPLVNWFSRTKEKSSVTDSVAPDSSVINYNKKKVTAPASILGGGKMVKEEKYIQKYKSNDEGEHQKYSSLTAKNKSKEGQKSKSSLSSFTSKKYPNPKDSSSTEYTVYKLDNKSFRKPTKLLRGVDKMDKDSSMKTEVTKYNSPDMKRKNISGWDYNNWTGNMETSKKVLGLPKKTEKNMKDSFDNMKPSPEYVVKKSKKSFQKY